MLRSLSTTRKELGALRAVFLRSQAVRRGANYGVRALSNTCHLQANSSTLNKPILSKPQVLSTWGYNFARSYASLPEHIRVPLPALSPTMERGSIVSWEKKEGDKLNEGDLLCEIETDKATMGFETPEEGYLAKILVPGGSKDVPIGQLVCIIVPDAESVAAFKDFQDTGSAPAAAPAAAAPPPPAPVAAAPVAAAVAPPPPPPPAAAPAAAQPKPAPAAAAAKPGAPAAFKDIPLTTMRSVIAKRLLESKQNLPHYYVTVECEVDKLLKLRANVNKKYEKEGVRVSVNDFIIKAVATACRKVPEANSAWMDTFIREYSDVDVSVAVSTDKGLITPIVFSADRKGVVEISKSVKELAGKARDNKLQPHEFQGGTISISNLGMFGVNQFCAVINPPQSCILAIGTTTKKLVADPDSLKGFREVNVLTVTLSADHRVVDGAVAAVWLKHFREFMEDPQTMIL
ncbi:dihydrolipoyllysine-residue acetyltransferase component of pyruvate dehydrogenase complex, mitochondrial isoform X3 [Drosophila sulfurigaster albostrigata]|uniref:Dihydrolipoamide acetyltransferase component of pyruvate dehydrogenase complex n=1 Tax=Drosophila albomicans TaxID=7291 RepID=A0A6P8XHR6_DROAB|nr:dihydrolipoyllysine-residue acetyltransferase component of pyruvate dehydrogenase complex, mitochondrial isoform X3 [Drosophila albomicans]XP_060651167.1 dihydrolipoyllysine-residue acetyltransferase component of pyruvate dehydrogenase complex, mitochondrial isoform X4 [Drosophila nasuta]XP_062123596.1 dihydrolipoyllysine-residue acetyltransferase component of pyruvate dehydrogenase complex, mitochondrial isoform X3 [Drosophila sulfurigaster albostrigata]